MNSVFTPEQLAELVRRAAAGELDPGIVLGIRQQPQAPSVPMFEVTAVIDYGQTLEQHVANGRAIDYASKNLTSRNFPRPSGLNGVVISDYVILGPYRRTVSNDEVLSDAALLGLYRPISEETLVVGRTHPDLVFVGLVEKPWLGPRGYRRVPVVIEGEAHLVWFDRDWCGHYSFLFRKSALGS